MKKVYEVSFQWDVAQISAARAITAMPFSRTAAAATETAAAAAAAGSSGGF